MTKRIMVVDDIDFILDLVEYLLQRAGYEVLTASDGLAALAQMETTVPDLLLLDLMMPKMSGYEVIDHLKQHHCPLPIILLTVVKHTPGEIEELGVAGYLRKPFHQSDLLRLLEEVLTPSPKSILLSEVTHSTGAGDQCPLYPLLPNLGGQIDARVGQQFSEKLRFTYTPVNGSGNQIAPCAFLELSSQAVSTSTLDTTVACRRCSRAVRLQSTQ